MAVVHSSIRVELTLKAFPRLSNVLESAIGTIPNAKLKRIFVLLGLCLQTCGRARIRRCRLDLSETIRSSAPEIMRTTVTAPASASVPSVHEARHNRDAALGDAAHFKTDHRELVRIVVHCQFSEKDI